jgi:hypothetical protein
MECLIPTFAQSSMLICPLRRSQRRNRVLVVVVVVHHRCRRMAWRWDTDNLIQRPTALLLPLDRHTHHYQGQQHLKTGDTERLLQAVRKLAVVAQMQPRMLQVRMAIGILLQEEESKEMRPQCLIRPPFLLPLTAALVTVIYQQGQPPFHRSSNRRSRNNTARMECLTQWHQATCLHVLLQQVCQTFFFATMLMPCLQR